VVGDLTEVELDRIPATLTLLHSPALARPGTSSEPMVFLTLSRNVGILLVCRPLKEADHLRSVRWPGLPPRSASPERQSFGTHRSRAGR
jgi:hypothetical protein